MLHLYYQLCECVCCVLTQQSAETVMVITLIPFWSHVANNARRAPYVECDGTAGTL